MKLEDLKKGFIQIEEWRKEVADKELKDIDDVTDTRILLYLAIKQINL